MEASEGCAVPKDLFLSLRVGDVQKFSKAGASKTYKFPAAAIGDRRYGKIEIYKRIGICSVMIDPGTLQGAHEISVPLDDDRLPNLRYRFNLAGEAMPEPKQENLLVDDKPLKDLNGRVKVAKEYLDKHQLEMRLSEAMQAVLRERPEDPGAFVADKLVNRAGMVTKINPNVPPAEKASAPPREEATAEKAPGGTPWDLKPSVGSWATRAGRLAQPSAAAPVPIHWQKAQSKTRSMQGLKRAGNFAAWMVDDSNAPLPIAVAEPQKPACWTSAPTPLLAPLRKKQQPDNMKAMKAKARTAVDLAMGEEDNLEDMKAKARRALDHAMGDDDGDEAAGKAAAARRCPAVISTGRTSLGRNGPFLIL